MVEKTLDLNLQNKALLRKIYAVQNDSGRYLKCIVSDTVLPDGLTARIYARKPSGKEVYNDCTVDGNEVTVKLTAQLLAEEGDVQCQIELSDGDRVTSFSFAISVQKSLISDSAIESTDEYPALEGLIIKADKAITDATEATTQATAATTQANSAVSKANTAIANANTAITNANNAASSATSAASSANTAATKANTATSNANEAADNANELYEKLKGIDTSTLNTAITNTLSVTGATTSPQAKKVTNLSGLSSPESWNTGFLMGDTSSDTVKIAGFGAIPSTSASMDNVDSNSELFGITATSNPYMKRFRLIDIFSSVSFGTLTTTAKTIIGAINELKTSLASNVAYVDATLDNISINSGNVVFKDFTMSKDGYTCIGVIMVQLGNGSTNGSSGSSGCICTGFYPTSTGVHVNIRNQGSNTAIIKVTARGLFVKN